MESWRNPQSFQFLDDQPYLSYYRKDPGDNDIRTIVLPTNGTQVVKRGEPHFPQKDRVTDISFLPSALVSTGLRG